ncbi:MAG: NUDIX domain-containing protein [Kiritimatiellia bacterium]
MSHEVIARGVLIRDGKILLCHPKDRSFAYLPGGHVETREKAADALVREIKEELGHDATVEAFLGCNEHAFRQVGTFHTEINLLFKIKVPTLSPQTLTPAACEDWLHFSWVELDRLDEVNLLPKETLAWLRNPKPPTFATYGDEWL